MSRVIHFEIHASDPEALIEFCSALLGWSFTKQEAMNAFICTVRVDALDETLVTNERLGGVVALPKMPVPGVGWLAYVKDPDGNLLGLTQLDEAAA
jgi:predicted enzyme related to lactoylglutathione lyase